MFACICFAVSDKQVAESVRAGADTVDAVGYCTGAGTGCGSCHERLEALISRHGDADAPAPLRMAPLRMAPLQVAAVAVAS